METIFYFSSYPIFYLDPGRYSLAIIELFYIVRVTGFYETSQKYFARMMDEWMNNDRTIKTCHNLAQLKLTFLSKQKNIHSIYS